MYKILSWGPIWCDQGKEFTFVSYLTPNGNHYGRIAQIHRCPLNGIDRVFIWISGVMYFYGDLPKIKKVVACA